MPAMDEDLLDVLANITPLDASEWWRKVEVKRAPVPYVRFTLAYFTIWAGIIWLACSLLS